MLYAEILVPLDGSPLAEEALPYGRMLATALDVPIELLSIVDPERLPDARSATIETGCTQALTYLERVARLLPPGLEARCTVETGDPAEAIATVADAREKPLVAMSTHGRSGLQRWLIGSVAQKTARATPYALLLLRARGEKASAETRTPRKLLVPLDGSSVAEQVIPHITYLAQKLGLEVVLLRAYEVHFRGHSHRMHQIEETVRETAQAYLEEKARQLEAQGVSVSCRIEHGNAAVKIVHAARELTDGMIAMSTHGHSGVRQWILGSNTSRIVQHATDPVLVIRATANGSE